MGLFKNFTKGIGNIIKDSALNGLAQGIRQTEMNNHWGLLGGILGSANLGGAEGEIMGGEDLLFGFNNKPLNNIENFNYFAGKHSNKFSGAATLVNATGAYDRDESGEYVLDLPDWNYGDFINERNIFIRHLSNGYDEPGWFYFKLFFDFNTNHGLFGGILNHNQQQNITYEESYPAHTIEVMDNEGNVKEELDYGYQGLMNEETYNFVGVNTAYRYLMDSAPIYKINKLDERAECLRRFVNLLSFINLNAPWFFKGIKNLSVAGNPVINNFSEEKSIEIELNQDAIDMRLTTLLSLYKFACYDDIFNKEIIPENLRKFDLCVVVFESPIKLLHTPIYKNGRKVSDFKSMGGTNPQNYMSFKLYKFLNCEIDITTIGGYVQDVQNENPFQLGQNTLKINYDKVYEYVMNDFMGSFMVGSDGVYFLYNNKTNKVVDADVNSSFTTLSEQFIRDNIGKVLKGQDHFALGNIYGQDKTLYKEKLNGSIDRTSGLSSSFTDYFIQKSQLLSNKLTSNTNAIMNTGFDLIYKLLGSSYHAGNALGTTGDGTVLNGHGQHGIGSAVWQAKMDRLTNINNGQSNREYRITTVNNAQNANWSKRLHDLALNSIKTPRL